MITREQIAERFTPILSRIQSDELKTKTLDAWMIGLEQGGWTELSQLEAMPYTLLTATHGVNFIEHCLAVALGAAALAQAQLDHYAKMPYPIDMDMVLAGGLLHDVGKLVEIEPDGQGGHRKSHAGQCMRHPISGAVIAKQAGLSDEIANLIACHSKEGDGRPQVIETIFVHQADFATFDTLRLLNDGRMIDPAGGAAPYGGPR